MLAAGKTSSWRQVPNASAGLSPRSRQVERVLWPCCDWKRARYFYTNLRYSTCIAL